MVVYEQRFSTICRAIILSTTAQFPVLYKLLAFESQAALLSSVHLRVFHVKENFPVVTLTAEILRSAERRLIRRAGVCGKVVERAAGNLPTAVPSEFPLYKRASPR